MTARNTSARKSPAGKTPAVQITVRGSHSVLAAPQQATVHAVLSAEGRVAEPVFRKVTGALAEVTASVEAQHHPKRGPVTRYAIDQVRIGSHRPWSGEGKRLPLVHTAVVSITAVFTDFDALAAWVAWGIGVDGLSISHVDWTLTDAKRLDVERKTRRKAVRDAQIRAQDYADALDLGPVTVLAISDPGLGERPQQKIVLARAMAAPAEESPQFELRPEEITITAEVEATFVIEGRR
ncbi:MAG: SIMPL domain-containing protein [Mycobacterium sp.]|jgi:uncharacterized protein